MERIVAIVMCLSLCLGAFAQEPVTEAAPEETLNEAVELDVLRPALHNKELFEKRVRTFDRLHVAIARYQYLRARELEEQGDAAAAHEASDKAQHHLRLVKAAYDLGLTHFSGSAVLHNYYGELLYDFFGRPHDAARYWQRAIQLDSRLARAHCNFGMYAMHNGMYVMGVQKLDKALELEPRNPDFLFNMTQVYLAHFPQIMQIRKWDRPRVYREAMKLSERATRYAPTAFDVLRDHALNYFVGEDFGATVKWRDAAKAWQKARSYARTDAELFNTWLNEARVHIRNNDNKRARQCLDAAEAIWPDSAIVQQMIEDLT